MPIINWLQIHGKALLYILGLAVTLQVCVLLPYGILAIPVVLAACFIFLPINMEKFTTALSFLIIFSGFFGSYLGIPGNENIFLFRLLIPIHLLLFLFFVRKDWAQLRYVKAYLILFIAFFCWDVGNWILGAAVRAEHSISVFYFRMAICHFFSYLLYS
ncbi:hypothetical protein PROCOU_14335 [Listeria rocourtiae FSL F6-920]|nr:hypothetical protein PROCOU_14335 [Listeria rocourtiae FSL F6-920]